MANGYVTRGMKVKCSCGGVDTFLNVKIDHGILFGEERQPLLNANDHNIGENIIPFGTCSSKMHPGQNIFLNTTCTPNTPISWSNCNEKNIIEGAPALMTNSFLCCRFGGVITIIES